MSVYHTSFNYLNKNSSQDFNLIISHFSDGADSGETETFMSMEPVYTDNAFGTKRIDYGAKYSSVAVFRITIIKQNGSELSVSDIRSYLKWLTGARVNSSLDLLIGDEIKYSFIGRFTNAWQYKMDARTCGLILEFTSISPWAYSPIQTLTHSIYGTMYIEIDNQSDDLYECIYPRVVYKNTTGSAFMIENTTTKEITQVTGLSKGETITIDGNLMITTDKPSKTFGNTFNFVFPRFVAGINNLAISGTGEFTIEYIMYLKVGDCARDINVVYDPICSEDGTIQVDMLPWERISNSPTTLQGYGITDAYTKEEVDTNKISDIRCITDSEENYPSIKYLDEYYYNYEEIDQFLSNKIDNTSGVIKTNHIAEGAITVSTLSDEVKALIGSGGGESDSSTYVEIDEQELNNMLAEVLGE
jgi:hypothetical protein